MEEPVQHPVGVEVLFGDGASRPRVTAVVAVQRLDAREHLVGRLKSKQPYPRGQIVAKTRLLGDDRPARGQVADASVAEPAAASCHVAALGDAELGLGAPYEPPVAGGRMRYPPWVYQA